MELEICAPLTAPWMERRYSLFTWWDMQRFSAERFFAIGQVLAVLEKMETAFCADLPATRRLFDTVVTSCEEIQLPLSAKKARWILGMGRMDGANFSAALGDLKSRIQDEMQSVMFFHVPAEYAKYYSESPIFGELVAESFPQAVEDINEAGACLACGRSTAAVYHVSRVLEWGLKSLAAEVGIDYAPSWEAYIKKIKASLDVPHKDKSPEQLKSEPFYRSIVGDIVALKHAWRNPTMHVGAIYTQERAEGILVAARAFMACLAERGQANGRA